MLSDLFSYCVMVSADSVTVSDVCYFQYNPNVPKVMKIMYATRQFKKFVYYRNIPMCYNFQCLQRDATAGVGFVISDQYKNTDQMPFIAIVLYGIWISLQPITVCEIDFSGCVVLLLNITSHNYFKDRHFRYLVSLCQCANYNYTPPNEVYVPIVVIWNNDF